MGELSEEAFTVSCGARRLTEHLPWVEKDWKALWNVHPGKRIHLPVKKQPPNPHRRHRCNKRHPLLSSSQSWQQGFQAVGQHAHGDGSENHTHDARDNAHA
jgi:hypothetical protein